MPRPELPPCTSLNCHYCQEPAALVDGLAIYPHRPDLAELRFWQCVPCKAYVGCHKGTTTPLGRLANADLRKAKTATHSAFDPLWKGGGMTRGEAYKWLQGAMNLTEEQCHIGEFNIGQCDQARWLCLGKENELYPNGRPRIT